MPLCLWRAKKKNLPGEWLFVVAVVSSFQNCRVLSRESRHVVVPQRGEQLLAERRQSAPYASSSNTDVENLNQTTRR